MARNKLRNFVWLSVAFSIVASIALADARAPHKRPPIGLTFDWSSIGTDIEVHFIRTQGGSNEREQHLHISKRSTAKFEYMTGDVDGIPDWVDVEWQYNLVEAATYEDEHKHAKPARAHLDLKAMIPDSAIEEVARDPDRKQLKLICTFNDDKLELRYEVFQWQT